MYRSVRSLCEEIVGRDCLRELKFLIKRSCQLDEEVLGCVR